MNKLTLRAYSVHIYTTIGIVCGFFALTAIYEENLKDAFFYLGLSIAFRFQIVLKEIKFIKKEKMCISYIAQKYYEIL